MKLKLTDAIEEWMMKEEGSYEDSRQRVDHAYHLLNKLTTDGVNLTENQKQTLIKSGQYHSTAWEDDEIYGGARTKRAIAKIVAKLKNL